MAFKLFQVNVLQIVTIFLVKLLFSLDFTLLSNFFITAVTIPDPKKALTL